MTVATTRERTAQLRAQVTPQLHRAVRVRAAQEGVSMTRYLIRTLERAVEQQQPEERETNK